MQIQRPVPGQLAGSDGRDAQAGNAANQICQLGACRLFRSCTENDYLRDPALRIATQRPGLFNRGNTEGGESGLSGLDLPSEAGQ